MNNDIATHDEQLATAQEYCELIVSRVREDEDVQLTDTDRANIRELLRDESLLEAAFAVANHDVEALVYAHENNPDLADYLHRITDALRDRVLCQ